MSSKSSPPAKPARKPRASRPVPAAGLRAALLKLPATRDGFEGLTARLIDAATGGALRLLASGDQLGVDGIGDPNGAGPRRAMQSKRYKPATSLDRTGLLGEMAAAHNGWPGIDCWVIASTQELQGTAAKAVRIFAEQLGWGLVTLDWSEIAPGFPRLATLCAAYIDIACGWPEIAKLRTSLETLAGTQGFAAARDKLIEELKGADTGFAAARAAGLAEVERIFSDAETARSIAGPSPALLVQAPPVARPGLRTMVSGWWASSTQAGVLLGIEGMGKTWEALDAARHLAGLTAGPMPIVIGSARARQAADGLAALISALSRIGEAAGMKLSDPAIFWQRRLALWSQAGAGASPRLLVIVDGLDELDPFDWAAWLAPLRVAERCGLIRLLLTCRPDEWRHRVGLSASDTLVELPVERFLPEERDAYLKARGIKLGEVSDVVLEAARHPRTAFHLTRLAAELGDLTRITREQLLLRDFQNLCEIKGGPIQAQVFETLVSDMAKQAQVAALAQEAFTITSGEVLDAAADLTGDTRDKMRRVLGDLVAGTWLERDADNATRFLFTDRALPDAVGFALASMIRKLGTTQALDEIDRFLEPWGADDLVERVLRTCATALVIDPLVSDELAGAVLSRWRVKPSHGGGGQDFWRRLHIFRPALFLHLAEDHGLQGDWLSEWGLACLWEDHLSTRPLVEGRLRDWLTTIPLPQEETGLKPEDEASANGERKRQLARLKGLERRVPGGWTNRIGRELADLPEDGASAAARVIGFLPRLRFLGTMRDWAINCAAAGRTIHVREMEALMRDVAMADGEAAVAGLRGIAVALEGSGSDLARKAAAILLRLAGDPDDAVRADSLDTPLTAQLRRYTVKRVDTDQGPRLARDHQMAVRPLHLIHALTGEVGDSDIDLDVGLAAELASAVAALTPDDVPALYESEGHMVAVMLRWHAPRFYDLLRAYLLTGPVPDDERDRGRFRYIAMGALPVLDDGEREALAGRLESSASAEGSGRGAATALRLAHRPLAGQIALLMGVPVSDRPRDFRHLLNAPVADEREKLIGEIDFSQPAEAVQRIVSLALAVLDRFGPVSVDRDWLGAFTYPDLEIRRDTTRLARLCGGDRAVQEFASLGLHAGNVQGFALAFEASGLLAGLGDAELRLRVTGLEHETLAHLYLNRPALRDAVLTPWRAWMQDQLGAPRTSWGLGAGRIEYRDRQEAYRAYVENERSQATALIRNSWENKATRSNIRFDHGAGPAWPLLQALAPLEPEMVEKIWRDTVGSGRFMWSSDEESFPARLPADPMFDSLRAEMLTRPRTDERLFGAVRSLERHGHRDFLIRWVSAGLEGTTPAIRAQAITVAGFLDASEAAIALWDGPLASPPAAGWLREVYHAARAWFRDAQRARHWYLAMRQAETEEQALRAFWLLNRVADPRVWLFFKTEPYRIPLESWRVQWLDFFSKAATQLRDKPLNEIKNSYLHDDRMNKVLNHY